jgi:hypothetical protein
MEKLFFLHIPKAAGTTINSILRQNFRAANDYWFNTTDTEGSYERLRKLTKHELNRITIVRGHFSFGFHRYFTDENYKYFTFLRDPVDRVVSKYYFAKMHPDHFMYKVINDNRLSLVDYVSSGVNGEVQNGQTKQIAGAFVNETYGYFDKGHISATNDDLLGIALKNIANDFAFVGLFEDLNTSVHLMRILLNRPKMLFHYTHLNRNPKRKESLGYEITESERRVIEEFNQVDIELYEKARRKFYIKKSGLGSIPDYSKSSVALETSLKLIRVVNKAIN